MVEMIKKKTFWITMIIICLVIIGGYIKFLKEACEKFKNKIALGLDAKNGSLFVSGWTENLKLKTLDFFFFA